MKTKFLPDKHIGFEAMLDNCCPFVRFIPSPTKNHRLFFFLDNGTYWRVTSCFHVSVGIRSGSSLARGVRKEHFYHSRYLPKPEQAQGWMCVGWVRLPLSGEFCRSTQLFRNRQFLSPLWSSQMFMASVGISASVQPLIVVKPLIMPVWARLAKWDIFTWRRM